MPAKESVVAEWTADKLDNPRYILERTWQCEPFSPQGLCNVLVWVGIRIRAGHLSFAGADTNHVKRAFDSVP